ncbi:hypothetical protein BJI69_14955 [Luteibacter rhizovicinus DSM 16549]|uniref:Uncharacterized protein n=2 Tax=Luteibacter rhizovicinus TaxID=242606 RepID=A0A1L3EVH6_9GAMM|nr:hypothetical protein BJI69_14955 [Luteibacter rhizovicinus DSM 16549]
MYVDCKARHDLRASSTLAMVAAVGVHVLVFLVIRIEMQPQVQTGMAAPSARDVALEVRFVGRASRPRAVASEDVQGRSAKASQVTSTTRPLPAPHAKPKAAAVPETSSVPAADAAVLRQSGAADVTTEATDMPAMHKTDGAPAIPNYAAPRPTDSAGIMSHKDIVGYTRSRFEDAWVPRDENVVSQGLRRAQDAATLKKTVDFGHGVRMHCAIGPLGGGCGFGDAPSKAAAKDGDTRLSMAPSHTLANDLPDAQALPSEAACVAAYRVDARVPQGCPTDTPLKAMDAENAERVRRTVQP